MGFDEPRRLASRKRAVPISEPEQLQLALRHSSPCRHHPDRPILTLERYAHLRITADPANCVPGQSGPVPRLGQVALAVADPVENLRIRVHDEGCGPGLLARRRHQSHQSVRVASPFPVVDVVLDRDLLRGFFHRSLESSSLVSCQRSVHRQEPMILIPLHRKRAQRFVLLRLHARDPALTQELRS
jgi:hypothetical protein